MPPRACTYTTANTILSVEFEAIGLALLRNGQAVDSYGRPLSVSGRPCYILPMFFLLFILLFLWPPYSPALVNVEYH